MAQYCRYCNSMVCGDENYCRTRKRCYTNDHIRHTNSCKDFDLNPIDALRINEQGYKPRKKIWKEDATQMTWDEVEKWY